MIKEHIIEVTDKYDRELINLILEIEKRYSQLNKQNKLKIESWIRKLCVPTLNKEWKKNRNLHAIAILNMIINNRVEEPYNKFADDSQNLFAADKSVIKSKLTENFYKLFNENLEENLDNFQYSVINKFLDNKYDKDGVVVKKLDKFDTKSNLISNRKIIREKIKDKLERSKSPLKNIKNIKIKTKNYFNTTSGFYKSNLKSSFVDYNLINKYVYTRDIENLKKLLHSLEQENKSQDEIILKLNEEKKSLSLRVKELENAIEKIIIDKDKVKIAKKVLLKNRNYF